MMDTTPASPASGMDPDLLREGILHHLDHPVVFSSMVEGWSCAGWSLEDWAAFFGNKKLDVRIGDRKETPYDPSPQWEAENRTASATARQLLDWAAGRPGKRKLNQDKPSPLAHVKPEVHWAYYAYKHIPLEFGDKAAAKLGIDWSPFGFAGRGADKSTLWFGTAGAHTLCHRDTYGLNLVVQLTGRKRWTLFPPSDESRLYPTRVPYEESTVFSAANIRRPDFARFPDLAHTRPHIVELSAGETLLVPRHWWHMVENLETSVSINTWIELPSDAEARLQEAMVRTLFSRLTDDAESAQMLMYPEDTRQDRWSLDTCLSVLCHSAGAVDSASVAPSAPRDRRAFWAAYRAWPGYRRVPPCRPEALIRPDQPPPAPERPGSTASSPDPVLSPLPPLRSGSPLQVNGAMEVFQALLEAVTDPAAVAAAAEAFKRALRRRGVAPDEVVGPGGDAR